MQCRHKMDELSKAMLTVVHPTAAGVCRRIHKVLVQGTRVVPGSLGHVKQHRFSK